MLVGPGDNDAPALAREAQVEAANGVGGHGPVEGTVGGASHRAVVTAIAPLRKHAIELAHPFGQIAIRRRDH